MGEAAYSIDLFREGVDDPAEIARLHLGVRRLQVATDNNTFLDFYESQVDLNAIGSYYVEPGGNFFVARDIGSGCIAGFVGIRNEGERVGALKRMAVMPKHRRRRVGLSLAQTAVGWSKANGFTKLTLTTGFKENAKPIYEAVGFKDVGTKNDKDWLMELEL